MKKHLLRQRGDHHALLIVGAVVALVGVLGFVGYNSWQKQSANAGKCNTINLSDKLATDKARVKCLQSNIADTNAQISRLANQINAHPKQTAQNNQRRAAIAQLQSDNADYNARIARLNQEIASMQAKAKPAPVISKVAPSNVPSETTSTTQCAPGYKLLGRSTDSLYQNKASNPVIKHCVNYALRADCFTLVDTIHPTVRKSMKLTVIGTSQTPNTTKVDAGNYYQYAGPICIKNQRSWSAAGIMTYQGKQTKVSMGSMK